MPTVLRIGPYRLFFYSNEYGEPPHIHIQHERALAKFWLSPLDLASSSGFPAHELSKLSKLVEEHNSELLEAWNEYFGN